MVQRGSDPVSGPSNEFYSNFPFTAHQSRIVPQACCVNPLAQHPVVNIPSEYQHADILTKALAFDVFAIHRRFLMNLNV